MSADQTDNTILGASIVAVFAGLMAFDPFGLRAPTITPVVLLRLHGNPSASADLVTLPKVRTEQACIDAAVRRVMLLAAPTGMPPQQPFFQVECRTDDQQP